MSHRQARLNRYCNSHYQRPNLRGSQIDRGLDHRAGERGRRAGAPSWLSDSTALFTIAGLAGIAVSITGNETAQRWGWARVVTVAMSTAAVLSLLTGWSATAPAILATALVVLWNTAIYFDSSP